MICVRVFAVGHCDSNSDLSIIQGPCAPSLKHALYKYGLYFIAFWTVQKTLWSMSWDYPSWEDLNHIKDTAVEDAINKLGPIRPI